MMKYTPTTTKRDLRIIGEDFAVQRKLLGLRVSDVAKRAGISETTVTNLEHGRPVRSDALITVARILQLADYMVKAADPYSHDLGMVRAAQILPKRVR